MEQQDTSVRPTWMVKGAWGDAVKDAGVTAPLGTRAVDSYGATFNNVSIVPSGPLADGKTMRLGGFDSALRDAFASPSQLRQALCNPVLRGLVRAQPNMVDHLVATTPGMRKALRAQPELRRQLESALGDTVRLVNAPSIAVGESVSARSSNSALIAAAGATAAALHMQDELVAYGIASSKRRCCIPLFTTLACLACFIMLLWELHVNAHGANPDAAPTQGCFFRLLINRNVTLCAASMTVNPTFGPTTDVLVTMGAKHGGRIRDGEVWRLVAPIFLHAGVVHCFSNVVVLAYLGNILEREHGFLKVGVIFMASGIYGYLMGSVFDPHSFSVGASGGVYGLIGAKTGMLLAGCGYGGKPLNRSALGTGVAIAVELLIGTMPMFDNFAHFFGFCMGLLCSLSLLDAYRAGARERCHGDLDLVKRHVSELVGEHPDGAWRRAEAGRGQRLLLRMLIRCGSTALALAAFGLGAAWLFGPSGGQAVCPWCARISCLPAPWGCDPQGEDCWWDCNNCLRADGVSATASFQGSPTNGTVVVRCPIMRRSGGGFENVTLWPVNVSDLDVSDVRELCKDHCPDAYF